MSGGHVHPLEQRLRGGIVDEALTAVVADLRGHVPDDNGRAQVAIKGDRGTARPEFAHPADHAAHQLLLLRSASDLPGRHREPALRRTAPVALAGTLARAVPDLLLDIVELGMTLIIWQIATLVQARRGAALVRWSIAVQGVGMVLDGVRRPAGALVRALGILLTLGGIALALVALALLLAGVAAILRHMWPRPPRWRRARATG